MKVKYLVLLSVVALLAGRARAQTLDYTPALASTQAGTYTDLGATGTVIATANPDDANSAAQPIGFSFPFEGTTYTEFVLNTNGCIRLGGTAPATAAIFQPYAQQGAGGPVDNAALTNLILPFDTDLTSSATAAAEYRVLTTGAAPNRVCTIQWKNVADKARPVTATDATLVPAQLASFAFQLKLYEVDHHVAFVYGPAVASSAATAYTSGTAGIKGTGSGSGQLVLAQKGSSQDWDNTLFVATPYTTNFGHNLRNTFLPDEGRTYVFGVRAANDGTVTELHTLGTALAAGAPLSVDVVVRNVGAGPMASLPLTLSIAGANAVTVPTQSTGTLAVGGTTVVTFSGIRLPLAGTNTITASLQDDGNTTNDVRTQSLRTSTSTISYAIDGAAITAGFGGYPAGETWATAARFSLAAPRTVTSVEAFLYDTGNGATYTSLVGQTVYGVVLNTTTGAVLARSPAHVVTGAEADTEYSFVLSVPLTLPAGDFLAGLAQVRPTGSPPFYPMGQQDEEPTRDNTFYMVNLTGSPATPAVVRDGRNLLGVTMSAVLATTPAAPALELEAYPNPSATGDFTLVLGAGHSGAASLAVEVMDRLGRRVYGGTACPNAATPLSLAGLPPGLYILRVGNGHEWARRQLCIAP